MEGRKPAPLTSPRADGDGRVRREVGHLDHRVGEGRRDRGHGVDGDQRVGPAGVAAGELHAGQHQRSTAIRRGADLEQAEGVGHHGRGQDLVDRHFAPVAGIRVGQTMPRVLDLDQREILLGRPEAIHAATGVQGEVGRIGGAHQVKTQPVRIVLALTSSDRGEEPLGRGVRADHQRHVAQTGQNLGPGVPDGGRPRRAGGVGTRHARARSSPMLARRWHRPRSPGTRCGWCRHPRRTECPARSARHHRAHHGRRPCRTRRRACPTCPRDACRHRGRRFSCRPARFTPPWTRPRASTSTPDGRGRLPNRGCQPPAPPRLRR